MYKKIKQYMKNSFPQRFVQLRAIKDQLILECRTLRQIGFFRIFSQLVKSKAKWKEELPVQSIKRIMIELDSFEEFSKKYAPYKEGGHTLYFPPDKNVSNSLKEIFTYLPVNTGLKVVKRQGGTKIPFPSEDKTCNTHAFLSPSHSELVLVHGVFYNLALGPRLYDLIEVEFLDGSVHAAYCVEHIEGTIPLQNACEEFIDDLKKIEAQNTLKLVNWNGYKDVDFTCPGCNGNLIYETASSSLKYVDLQNFALGDYFSYLKNIIHEASKASHFGQKSYLLGGEYLYQEVPGLNVLGKRSPSNRFEVFEKLLANAHLTVEDKFVIDVGCNLGLMGAQYLKSGASWVHGFDMPEVVPFTEKVLLSVGCTRFSTTGVRLSEEISLINNLPDHLKDKLEGSVISYLAIRGHIGWVRELGKIPWDFMLYEGHELEDEATNQFFLSELNEIQPCSIVAQGYVSDANSAWRYIAIVKSKR